MVLVIAKIVSTSVLVLVPKPNYHIELSLLIVRELNTLDAPWLVNDKTLFVGE